MNLPRSRISEQIAEIVEPLTGKSDQYDRIVERAGAASLVLIGEATHGTHEFYVHRAEITKRLIAERRFDAVAIEGDWPEAARVHRWVNGADGDRSATGALSGFKRFPAWMWRNSVVLDFVSWLRTHNDSCTDAHRRVGFYGLDLYSLHDSISAIIGYLENVDPAAARRARTRYSCFDHSGRDPHGYGREAAFDLSKSCEEEVVRQLIELRRSALEYSSRGGDSVEDVFFAEQNARLVRNAEAYYRSMFLKRASSWNMRDQHMAETIEAIRDHREQAHGSARIIVWEHNTHLGDARATEMGSDGELNVGQLARERYGRQVVTIGFTSYGGTVTAASDWGGTAERKVMRPALPESYEDMFHQVGVPAFVLDLRRAGSSLRDLVRARLQRAIGVVYLPEAERRSHYFLAVMPLQFDLVIHVDQTSALTPLEREAGWDAEDVPATFPSGL